MLGFLTDWFQAILCAIENIAYWLLHLVVAGINAIIVGAAELIAAAIAILPDMPTTPATPSEVTTAANWIAWVIPTSTIVDFLTFAFAVWLLWQLVVILLRWVKATDQ